MKKSKQNQFTEVAAPGKVGRSHNCKLVDLWRALLALSTSTTTSPTLDTLAQTAGMHRATVCRNLHRLEALGHIRRERQHGPRGEDLPSRLVLTSTPNAAATAPGKPLAALSGSTLRDGTTQHRGRPCELP